MSQTGAQVLAEGDGIDFGPVPEAIDALLQEGVVAYRHDKPTADRVFRQALESAPDSLPVYYCLYKIHTYQGSLDEAKAIAESGTREAARQAGWPEAWCMWTPQVPIPDGAGRFALYTLKALAFIYLRRDEAEKARVVLEHLAKLDPAGTVGWPVIADLASGLSADGL